MSLKVLDKEDLFQIAIPARFSKNLQDRNKYASERQGQVKKTTNRIIFEPSQKRVS